MNDVYLDGYILGSMKMGKKYLFTLYNPIKKTYFLCETKLKEIKNIGSEVIVGIKGSIEGELKIIKVTKIKQYGVEE